MNNAFFSMLWQKLEKYFLYKIIFKQEWSSWILSHNSETDTFHAFFFFLPYPFSISVSPMQIRTRGLSLHCLDLKITVGLQMWAVWRLLEFDFCFRFSGKIFWSKSMSYMSHQYLFEYFLLQNGLKTMYCAYTVLCKGKEMRHSQLH